MDALEEQVRELLAAEYERRGNHVMAEAIRRGELPFGVDERLIRAVVAALRQSEGDRTEDWPT